MTKFHPVYREYPRTLRTAGIPITAANPVRTVSGLFRTPELVEQAFAAIERFGYDRKAFNVMVTRRIQELIFPSNEPETGRRSVESAQFGALVGAILATAVVIGTVLVLHGPAAMLGVSSFAAGVAGLGIGTLMGYLIGGRSHIGTSAPEASERKKNPGGILVSIVPASNHDRARIAEAWEAIGGENIHH